MDQLLNKIEQAMNELLDSKGKEATIALTFDDLLRLRKNILVENLNTELSMEYMKTGIEFRQKQREIRTIK